MVADVLLISSDLKLQQQIENELDSFHILMKTANSFSFELIKTCFAIIWDLGNVPLPTDPALLSFIRNQVVGPIIILDKQNRPNSFIKQCFMDYHFDDYLYKRPIPEIGYRLVQKMWAYQKSVPLANRKQNESQNIISTANLKINLDTFTVLVDNHPIKLSPIEYKLLLFFMEHQGVVLNRVQIAAEVWENTSGATLRIIDTHISNLRKKIELNPKSPRLLRTIRGFGYMFGN